MDITTANNSVKQPTTCTDCGLSMCVFCVLVLGHAETQPEAATAVSVDHVGTWSGGHTQPGMWSQRWVTFSSFTRFIHMWQFIEYVSLY